MWSLTASELPMVLYPLGFSVLLILAGVVLRRKIVAKYLYSFTIACALVLLGDGLFNLWWRFYSHHLVPPSHTIYFTYLASPEGIAAEVISAACGTASLLVALWIPRLHSFALLGSGLMIGYFAFLLTIGFHELQIAFIRAMFGWWVFSLFLFVLLPVAFAAAVLSFARALGNELKWRHGATPTPALPIA